jgi:hypothetical protein
MKKRVRIYKKGGQPENKLRNWMMQVGGTPQQSQITDEQITSYVMNILQNDPTADPNDIYKALVSQGVNESRANSILSSIIDYINDARKVEMSEKTDQPELAQQEAEEMNMLNNMAEAEAQARKAAMMQMAMEDTEANDMTADDVDNAIYDDTLMMEGGEKLPSKSKFVNQVVKQYKKGGSTKIGQGQKPDEASLNAATNFIQSLNKESNMAKLKQEAENYYDNVMLPQAQRGREMRTQRMLNRGLNQIFGGSSPGISPYAYSGANPFGAQLKTANIDVKKTGLFGRPKKYSVQFDWDYPEIAREVINLENNNARDEAIKQQQQQKAADNSTDYDNSIRKYAEKRAKTIKKGNKVVKEESKRVGGGDLEIDEEWFKKNNIKDLEGEDAKKWLEEYEKRLLKMKELKERYKYKPRIQEEDRVVKPPKTGNNIDFENIEPMIGYPGAGIGGLLSDLYSWATGDEDVDRNLWDQNVAAMLTPVPAKLPTNWSWYKPSTPKPSGYISSPNTPGIPSPGLPSPGLPGTGLPAGPAGYLPSGPAGYINAPGGTQLTIPFGYQLGGNVNPFELDSNGLSKFIYGGKKKRLNSYQDRGETNEETTEETNDYQATIDAYEKRIADLENRFQQMSTQRPGTDMYGRQLPPPLFGGRQRKRANPFGYAGMFGGLAPIAQYVGSWNQTSMYDPETGKTLSPDALKGLLPTNIKVKSGLFKPVKNLEIQFGTPGSSSITKDELKKQRDKQLINLNSADNVDTENQITKVEELYPTTNKRGTLIAYKDRDQDTWWQGMKNRLQHKRDMNREFRTDELDPYREMYDNRQEEFDNPFDGRARKRRVKSLEYEYKLGGIPKFQSESEVNLYTSNPYEEEDEALLNYGVENDYGTLTIPDYTETPKLMTEEGYNDYFSPSQTIQRQSDMIGTGSGTATVKPKSAILKSKVKNTYVVDPTSFLDFGNTLGFAVTNKANQPEEDMSYGYGDNLFDPNQTLNDQGGYDLNSGIYTPRYTGFEGKVQRGGSIYNVDDEIELTEEEIAEFIRNGGQLEYL